MAAKAKATTTKRATKKPAAKRATPKKSTRTVRKAAKQPAFLDVKFTDQSVYWLIFGAVAIIFAIWIYTLDAKVRDLYDQVDANTYSMQATTHRSLL